MTDIDDLRERYATPRRGQPMGPRRSAALAASETRLQDSEGELAFTTRRVKTCQRTDGTPAEPCPMCSEPGRCLDPSSATNQCQCTACGFFYLENARRHGLFRIEVYRDREWWPVTVKEAQAAVGCEGQGRQLVEGKQARWLSDTAKGLKAASPQRDLRIIRPGSERAFLRF